jgi:hypothetical protein
VRGAGWIRGEIRTRLYRRTYCAVGQHLEQLGGRLRRLGFVTGNVTGAGGGGRDEEPGDTEVSTGDDLPEWARRDSNARPLAPEASALSN